MPFNPADVQDIADKAAKFGADLVGKNILKITDPAAQTALEDAAAGVVDAALLVWKAVNAVNAAKAKPATAAPAPKEVA